MKKIIATMIIMIVSYSAHAMPILLLSGDAQVRHRDPDAVGVGNPLGLATDSLQFFGSPFSQTISTSIGNSSGSALVAFMESATSATFSVQMEHAFDNSIGSVGAVDSASTNGLLDFIATEDATYSFSGNHQATGANGYALSLQVFFTDITSPVCCFSDETASQNLSGTNAIAAGVIGDGNDRDFFGGSLTGNLIAGHEYQLRFNFAIGNDTDGFGGPTVTPNNSSATAFGELLFQIGSPVSVPEPSIIALFAAGLFGLGLARRRIRS